MRIDPLNSGSSVRIAFISSTKLGPRQALLITASALIESPRRRIHARVHVVRHHIAEISRLETLGQRACRRWLRR